MKCVLFGGSVRENSSTRVVMAGLATRLAARDVLVDDLCLHPESPAIRPEPAYHKAPQDSPTAAVRDLVARFDAADMVVLGSPVYHGSISGLVKLGLDHLRWDQFRGRPVGMVVHGGSAVAGSSVCDHLRGVIRTMAGYATQTQVITGRGDLELLPNGEVALSSAVQDRLDRLADELVHLAQRLA